LSVLLQQTIDAHGGIGRWRQFETVAAHPRNGEILWPLKHQEDVLDDINVNVWKVRTYHDKQA
jgi:hypothetical protein